MDLAVSQASMKTRGGYPCFQSYTGSHPEWMKEWCTCVYNSYPGICDCLHVSMYLLLFFFFFCTFLSSARFRSNLSTVRHSLSSLSCLNTFKSFLLMQGTIKLSNGHNHYVKGGLCCQQFEQSAS